MCSLQIKVKYHPPLWDWFPLSFFFTIPATTGLDFVQKNEGQIYGTKVVRQH